jgi:cyclopropane fatty-acyl-phospholipid synthase-like methyltransferase
MTLANAPGVRQARRAVRRLRPLGSSASYWERRYRAGGTSGDGSYGENARAKAQIINEIVREHDVSSVVEFGCGDGNQLSLLDLASYVGLDVSATAITLCDKRFAADQTKSFFRYDPEHFVDRAHVFRRDLALSQEVIFHLVEDDVFELYLRHLFEAADRFVLICSSDHESRPTKHVRHRHFTRWVSAQHTEWAMLSHIPNPQGYDATTGEGMLADFYLYGRVTS